MMMQAMVRTRWRPAALIVGTGALLWVAIYIAAANYAAQRGLPLWPTVVTWDEWVAAVGLLPTMLLLLVGIRHPGDVMNPVAKRIIRRINIVSLIMLVTFGIDLVIRATLGLGWKPF